MTTWIDLKDEIEEILRKRAITRAELRDALKKAFETAYAKAQEMEDPPDNFRVEVDLARGSIQAYLVKRVLTEARNPETEVSIAEIRQRGLDLPVRSFHQEPVDFGNLSRIAIQGALRVLDEEIQAYERENLFRKAAEMEGTNVYGEIFKVVRDTAWVEVGKIEGILRRGERIEGEARKQKIKTGVRAYVMGVVRDRNGRPQLLLSRTHPEFLRRIMEENIPEIAQGVIEVRRVVRRPGHRAKVAVHATDPTVEPLGACIGPGGRRINAVIKELSMEKIDVVKWDERPRQFIANSLRPVQVAPENVRLLTYLAQIPREEGRPPRRKAIVIVTMDEKNRAIGVEGENAGLAARITGWSIDIWDRPGFENLPERRLDDPAFEMPTHLVEALEAHEVVEVRDLFQFSARELEALDGVGADGARLLLTFLFDVGILEEAEMGEAPEPDEAAMDAPADSPEEAPAEAQ